MNQKNHTITRVFKKTSVAIHLQDCVKGMSERIEPGAIDVVVTSPPYNIGVRYNKYDDKSDRSAYLAWTEKWTEAVFSVLSEDGSFFLNISGKPTDPWVPFEVATVVRRRFALQNTIHWIKSLAIMKHDVGNYPGVEKNVVVGHYKPINSRCYVNDAHEYIFHFTKTGRVTLDRLAVGVPYQDESNIGRWKSREKKHLHCRGNTWFIPYRTIMNRKKERPHPASFPPKLPAMCMKLHGLQRCRRVLDPFMGIGNTALAAAQLEIPEVIGFEIDAEYASWAIEALDKAAECRPIHQEELDFSAEQ